MWKNDTKPFDSIEYLDLIELSKDFYPTVADAIKIEATLPTTTCSRPGTEPMWVISH